MTNALGQRNHVSVEWLIEPTSDFQQAVYFYKEIIGLRLIEEGVSQTDYHFNRYAQFRLENGITLEIVEPKKEYKDLFVHPIRSLKVDNLRAHRQRLIEKGVMFISDILDSGTGDGWTYLKGADGYIVQLEGPLE